MAFPHIILRQWYDNHGRHTLPWRNTSDPYAIWVSEIMLQQTQVSTVMERYYHPFLTRFPTVTSLAEAPMDAVLKLWEGLGYYSRARNLHKAAVLTAPALPTKVEELLALPGIGQNTAHAIAAFAYRHPVAVMEANVKRVLHRLMAREYLAEKELWTLAQSLVDTSDPFTHNQAMMDIGALICTPRLPRCSECPLAEACAGKEKPHAYPAPKEKKTIPQRTRLLLIAQDSTGRLHLKPRTGNFLGGLYGFPEFSTPSATLSFQNQEVSLQALTFLGRITHTYSHFRLEGEVYLLPLAQKGRGAYWYALDEIAMLALAKADQKALKLYLHALS